MVSCSIGDIRHRLPAASGTLPDWGGVRQGRSLRPRQEVRGAAGRLANLHAGKHSLPLTRAPGRAVTAMPLGIPFPFSLMPDRSAPARTSTSKRTTLRRIYSRSPFPHMHYCTFVIIGPQGDPDALVAGTLAPFDEALAVPPYREYLQPFDIERMASHYTLDQRDLDALAQRMKDWTGRPGGVDERGLYFTTTNNPQGRWDWFEIGGRWNGLLKRASRNVISTRALRKSLDLKDLLPNADYRPQQRGKIRNESEIRNPNVQKTHASTCRHAGTIGRPVLF